MKYLNRVNEAKKISKKSKKAELKNNLKTFCEEYLIELIDSNKIVLEIYNVSSSGNSVKFAIKIRPHHQPLSETEEEIRQQKIENGEISFFHDMLHWYDNESPRFRWGDIKDTFIPFFSLIDDEYELAYLLNNDKGKCYVKFTFIPTSSYYQDNYKTKSDIFNDKIDDDKVFSEIIIWVSFNLE